MSALDDRELILGVTGSIAAYKAVYLLRELTRAGARVSVCLSEHAREFVGPLTFRTLSGRPVLSHLFDPQSDDAVEHVALAEGVYRYRFNHDANERRRIRMSVYTAVPGITAFAIKDGLPIVAMLSGVAAARRLTRLPRRRSGCAVHRKQS